MMHKTNSTIGTRPFAGDKENPHPLPSGEGPHSRAGHTVGDTDSHSKDEKGNPQRFESSMESGKSQAKDKTDLFSQANLQQVEAQNKSLIDALQRLAADFDNCKKRAAKEALSAKVLAEKDLIIDLLPVLDYMELALKTISGSDGARSGIELTVAQLISILEKHGLCAMDAIGQPFNPQLHEALLAEPGEHKGKVIEVLQKGYLLNATVIRTAKVKISS